jgi:hypothetical protein
VSENHYRSFSEFWPFYLSQHSHPLNRAIHVIGTVLALMLLMGLISFGYFLWVPICLVVGYGPAWVGHFIIEKNRPATFQYPLWSLMGDLNMCFLYLTRQFHKIHKHLK